MSQRVRFDINIPTEQILAYYRGIARQISVVAHDGRRIEFPADKLRPYMDHWGVRGVFELEFDDNHRFVTLHRIR